MSFVAHCMSDFRVMSCVPIAEDKAECAHGKEIAINFYDKFRNPAQRVSLVLPLTQIDTINPRHSSAHIQVSLYSRRSLMTTKSIHRALFERARILFVSQTGSRDL
jgi:hypothetical protein